MPRSRKPNSVLVAEAFLDALNASGIDHVFANAGTDFASILESLVKAEQSGKKVHIELVRVEALAQRVGVSLLPVFAQIVIELARPSDASFEKRELELWETARDTSHEQRPGEKLAAYGEEKRAR